MMQSVNQISPEMLAALAAILQLAAPVERCTGKIIRQLRLRHPDLKASDMDLAQTVARVGLDCGAVVYISDEPA